MQFSELGSTGIKVSVIAMGCWAIAGDATWGPQDDEDSLNTIQTALDEGINFFDTAEGYGNGYSEQILGRALRGKRDKAVIATKVSRSNLRYGDLIKACERSLGNLKTDYIDLYQIHWPNWDIPLEETVKAIEKLKKDGKIRAAGVSNFGERDLSDMLELTEVVTDQLPYSLLWRAIEYGIKQKCVENGVGILCYSPLAQGLLTGKFLTPEDVPEGRARSRFFSGNRDMARHGGKGCEKEVFAAIKRIKEICDGINEPMYKVALAWLLHQQGVTSVLVGARRPEQIKKNIKAADLKLTQDVIDKLTEVTEEVKVKIGSNPDMWQSESRIR